MLRRSLVTRFVLYGSFSVAIIACASTAPPKAPPLASTPLPSSPPLRLAAAATDESTPKAATDSTSTSYAAESSTSPEPAEAPPNGCPTEMVLVEGSYCTEARQTCAEWLDPPSLKVARCKEFAPAECVGPREKKRFCIDRDEYTKQGEAMPETDVSWTHAKESCEHQGKRLCYETEWELACEGEQMLAYSIGNKRDSNKCNYDKTDLMDNRGKLRDYRKASKDLDSCKSPYGVRNMTGNVDEWTFRDRTNGQWRSAMKGGWWMAARNRCRPATTAHDELYSGFQSGYRCCANAK